MWRVEIDQEFCKGCDICLELCPKQVFQESDEISPKGFKKRVPLFSERCVGCLICEELCPDLAISVWRVEQ